MAPKLIEQPYLWGAKWIDAALQGLAEAAVGLLHALHLEKARKRRDFKLSAPERPSTLTLAGPYFPTKLFATYHLWLTPPLQLLSRGDTGIHPFLQTSFFEGPEKNTKLPTSSGNAGRGTLATCTTSLMPQLPPNCSSQLPLPPLHSPSRAPTWRLREMSWESRPRSVRLARSGLPDTAVRPSGLRYMPLGGRRRVRSGWWRY